MNVALAMGLKLVHLHQVPQPIKHRNKSARI